MNPDLSTRVKTVYYLRRVADPVVVKSGSLLGLLLLFWFQVSLLDVAANTPSITRPADFSSFFYHAFRDTEWLVKLMIIALSFFALGLGLSLIRLVKPFVRPSRVLNLMPLRLKG